MAIKEQLKSILQFYQGSVKKQLDDLSEEESLKKLFDLVNHVRWITGHIAYYANDINRLVGGESDFPDDWLHFRGGEPLKEDAWYPPFKDIRAKLYSLYDSINANIDNLTDDDLNQVFELYDQWKPTRFDGIIYLLTHETYHSGQITIIRKAIGKPALEG